MKPPPLESKIQAKIIKYLKSIGIPYYKTSAMSSRGWTDLVLCYNGHYVGLEVKRPGKYGKLSALQAKHIETIRMAGGYAFVVCDVEGVKECLKEIDDEP